MIPFFGLLAACGTPAARPMPLSESGPVEVIIGDASFIADLQPGPVLTVSRDAPMGNDQGKLAKDVAAQFCSSRGSSVSPQAYGRYAAGTWVFEGGCA